MENEPGLHYGFYAKELRYFIKISHPSYKNRPSPSIATAAEPNHIPPLDSMPHAAIGLHSQRHTHKPLCFPAGILLRFSQRPNTPHVKMSLRIHKSLTAGVLALLCISIYMSSFRCSSSSPNSTARFQIGIYGVDSPEHLQELSEAGFDTIQTCINDYDSLQTLATEARRLGIGLVIYPDKLKATSSSALKHWPISAWYLVDEPDVNHMSSHTLRAIAAEVRDWDPRPQTFVVGSGKAAATYGDITDILMVDWYPVPHLKLDSVLEELDTARSHCLPSKPIWMVIQAFDWREHRQGNPTAPRIGRYPTRLELRFMTYSTIVHGAKSIFYYSFQSPSGITRIEHPEEWQAIVAVTQELKEMKPVFEQGRREELPLATSTPGVEAGAWLFKGRRYEIYFNRTAAARPLPMTLNQAKEFRPLFEISRCLDDILPLADGRFVLPPWRVLVLEGTSP